MNQILSPNDQSMNAYIKNVGNQPQIPTTMGGINTINQVNQLNQLNQINQLNQMNMIQQQMGFINSLNNLNGMNMGMGLARGNQINNVGMSPFNQIPFGGFGNIGGIRNGRM